MPKNLAELCVSLSGRIHDAVSCIDRGQAKIALIVDAEGVLLDTVTDGDVRRALLAGLGLESSLRELRDRKTHSPIPVPMTASAGTDASVLLALMQRRRIRHVPLVDTQHRLVGLATLRDLLPSTTLPLQAVIMAGGYGNRLQPLTKDLPKVMLPVGDRPLLELLVEQLREAGIRQVNLATHYKGEQIAQHFGTGRAFGVEIRYVNEEQPLGTAGALSLLEASEDPLLVVNGDILTKVDFRAMLDFHVEHHADMTVAVHQHEVTLPYGVVETTGVLVTAIAEKPALRHFINAGIYLLSQEARRSVPHGRPCDMPELITRLLTQRRRVVSFPLREYWLDIGHLENYQQAVEQGGKPKD